MELRELPFCKYNLFLISLLLFSWTQTLGSTGIWRKIFTQFLKDNNSITLLVVFIALYSYCQVLVSAVSVPTCKNNKST